MPCTQWNERLIERLYGEIAPEDDRAVSAHLDTCADCRSTLREFERVGAVLRDHVRGVVRGAVGFFVAFRFGIERPEDGELEEVTVVVDDLDAVLGLTEGQRDALVPREPREVAAHRLLLAGLREDEEVVVGPLVGFGRLAGHRPDGDEAEHARIGLQAPAQLLREFVECGSLHGTPLLLRTLPGGRTATATVRAPAAGR